MKNTSPRLKVLIEATKLMEGPRDGCYRYTSELLRAILTRPEASSRRWDLQCYIQGNVHKLLSLSRVILEGRLLAESRLLKLSRITVSLAARIRQRVAWLLSSLASDRMVEYLRSIDQKAGITTQLENVHQGRPVDGSGYDVVHLTLPQAYRCIEPASDTRFVVTIHDCTHRRFPQFHLKENVRAAEEGIKFALDRNAHFVANSETTRQEFLAEYGADPSRVYVTPLAVDRSRFKKLDDPEASSRMRSKYGIPDEPFFLALSTLEPRKNLINTARAFVSFRKQHPHERTVLVIAGREGWKFEDLLSDQSAGDERIFFTGYVEEDDLPILYSGAVALLFVSHYEGFGLPALEGMSCGLPVVFGKRGALPEVVGEGGLSAEPDDVEDIKEKLVQLAFNPELREELSLKALKRADQFSWAKTAEKTLNIYRQVADLDS